VALAPVATAATWDVADVVAVAAAVVAAAVVAAVAVVVAAVAAACWTVMCLMIMADVDVVPVPAAQLAPLLLAVVLVLQMNLYCYQQHYAAAADDVDAIDDPDAPYPSSNRASSRAHKTMPLLPAACLRASPPASPSPAPPRPPPPPAQSVR